MARRIPIRAKVAGALTVPLVGLVAAGAMGVSATTAQAREVTRQAELATASIGHAGLIGALQDERNLAVLEMHGVADGFLLEVGDTATARRLTDEAATTLQRSIVDHDTTLRDDYEEALDTLSELDALREGVDDAAADPGPHNRDEAHDASQATDAAARLVEEILYLWPDPVLLLASTPLGPDDGYLAFRDEVVSILDDQAAELRARADARRRLYLVGVGGLVAAALVVAWAVSRSITRPLRMLSVEARSMATRRLPEAVDDPERTETDPARLRKLYRLDHLATRIRRNAESLLVLMHADAPLTSKPPVEVDDVVRAALGVIESYERVLIRTLDPALVLGSAAADVVHLLAELVENGLRHSPPHQLVEVSGRVTDEGYAVTVVDHGLGMTPDEIAQANQRLAGTESFTVTPAKYLGHYVAAVLARRHGIRVRLDGSVVDGISALVELPRALLVDPAFALDGSPVPSSDGDGDPATNGDTADDDEGAGATPGEGAGSTPSAGAVRDAVARVRSGQVDGSDDGARRLRPWPASVTTRARGPAAGDGRPAAAPGRTASGLVRRVPGAFISPGRAAPRRRPPAGDATPGPSDRQSSAPVDGAEIRRFLTSLTSGVQRGLDDQNPEQTPEDEG